MARVISAVNTASDTFGIWVQQTNEVINAFSSEIMTANSLANGATTTGNAYLIGTFAGTILAGGSLRGGNVQTSNTLNVSSNVLIQTGNTLSLGNSVSNVSLTHSNIVLSNSTSNVLITKSSIGGATSGQHFTVVANSANVITAFANGNMAVGANTTVTDKLRVEGTFSVLTSAGIGNSVANVFANASSIKLSNSVSNITISIPNTVQVTSNNSYLHANGSYVTPTIEPNTFVVGIFGAATLTANGSLRGGNITTTTVLTVSSNVLVSTGNTLSVGNATVNVVHSETGLSFSNTFVVNTSVAGTISAANFNIIANNVNVITVAANGNVGIGNTIPADKLRVSGTLSVLTSATVGNSTAGVIANTSSVTITANSTNFITIRTPTPSEANAINSFLHANGSYVAANPTAGNPGGSNTNVQFNDSTVSGGSAGLTFNKTTNNAFLANSLVVGVGLYVNSALISTVNTTTTGLSAQNIDTFSVSEFRTAEYLFSVNDNTANNKHVSKLIVVYDGSVSPLLVEYAVAYSNTSLGYFTTTANSTIVAVQFNPTSSNTTVRGVRTAVAL